MKTNVELGDVVRRFAPSYLKIQGEKILPSQKKALSDIAACHTEILGGQQFVCKDCSKKFWHYHSCRNRSCPACHGRDTKKWLDKRKAEIFECGYYHIIVTVPSDIRAAFLANQKKMYSLLMKCAAQSVIELARDKKYLGATPAVLLVLHTWGNNLQYHPHVHMLVSAGGISNDGENWKTPRNNKFLIPCKALSTLVRIKFGALLKRSDPELYFSLPSKIWYSGWNSFLKHYGTGSESILAYLGRYVFRIAIANARIISMDDTHVSFKVKNRKTGEWKCLKLTGEEFLRRFVMHILPRGFHKVRYYGLWHYSKRHLQNKVHILLCQDSKPKEINTLIEHITEEESGLEKIFTPECPHCGCKDIMLIAVVSMHRSP